MRFFLLSLFLFISASSTAQDISSTDLVMDCMKQDGELPNKQLAIWYPLEFWNVIGKQMNLPKDAVAKVTDIMKDYVLVCVVDYSYINQVISFKDADEIRASIKMTDSAGKHHLPLGNDKIAPELKEMINAMKPFLKQSMGQMGEGMALFVFKMPKADGVPTITAKSTNHFSLTWDNVNMQWNLPLASMLPPKYCPKDHEQMKGTWNYCPIHGITLN